MAWILLFVIWTWGLTPLWVNIVCTVLCVLKILDDVGEIIGKI